MGGHHGKRQGICPVMVVGVFRSCEIVEKAPREIASPTGVSHATDFLSRVSKKAGFIGGVPEVLGSPKIIDVPIVLPI